MAATDKSDGRAAALQRNVATLSNGPTRGAYTEIVRNGLGARGIDYVEVFKTGSATSVRFPVYDGHVNMTACLLRDGSGGFTLTSRRAYDPWGAMRQWGTHPSGASAYQGAPSNRYVGSLGHQQDDDSGLYYMRARYYEPGSGRFISEDPAMDGGNWFAYCGNDPVNRFDRNGKTSFFAEMNNLMVEFHQVMVMSSGLAAIYRIRQLIAALQTYVGLAQSEIIRLEVNIAYLEGEMIKDPDAERNRQRIEMIQAERGAQGMSKVDVIVGRIYNPQMELGIIINILGRGL